MTTPLPYRRKHRSVAPALGAIVALATTLAVPLQAHLIHNFGSGGNAFTMDFVTIGNPGNSADDTGYGAVATSFLMGKYEVSRDMISKASSAGSLGITLADMSLYGGNGVNRPAPGVSWNEAARFVNWLNVSKGYSAAYKFSAQPGEGGYDANANIELWASGDAGYDASNPYRNANAVYFLPSENEWYKAAYYSPGGVYYSYPAGSDTAPTAVAGGTAPGTAVYDQYEYQGPADIANAGGVSPYGTMGQGGNALEYSESAWDGSNNSVSENRGLRGSGWRYSAITLESSSRLLSTSPTIGSRYFGFRVAAVPEPSGLSLLAMGLVALVCWPRSRRLA